MKEIIHIGFPKTATTTLQAHLFSRHPDLANIGRPFRDRDHGNLINSLAQADDCDYDEGRMAALIEESRKLPGTTLIYSDETVAASSIRSIAAKRLHRLFPNAHIVAVVREQLSAWESLYAHHGRKLRGIPEPYRGRHVSFDAFLAYEHKKAGRGLLRTFQYAEILDFYATLFGRDRIHVLTFEEFISDKPAFIARMAEHLGIDAQAANALLEAKHEYKRVSKSTVKWQKIRSRFLWGVPISRFVPGSQHLKKLLLALSPPNNRSLEIHWPEEWRERVAELYRPGNRVLMKKYGLPLDRLGYPL
jgi:hypothetical protein